jgi:tetratricopeptide (TPR) repeat protein
MMDRRAAPLLAYAPLHTDDNRLVEMREPRSLVDGTATQQARTLAAWQTDVRARLDVWPPPGVPVAYADSALAHAVQARRHEIEARSLEAAGQGAKAVEEYEKAVAANPKDFAIRKNLAAHHVRMGVALARSDQYEGAWQNFTAAIRADSASASAWGNFGLLVASAGQEEQALDATRRAEALDPRDETYARQEGDILRDHRRFEEAVAAYRRALEIWPRESRTLLALAECLARSGDAAGATETLAAARREGASRDEVTALEHLLAAP